jgi:hypothetical protein
MVQTKPMQMTQVGEEIGMALGAQMISAYRTANPSDVTSYYAGRNILEQILAQPGCAGIKFYNAYNEVGEKTLVYVGVTAEGNVMLNVSSINVSGQLENNKGIVADRVLVGGLENGGSWWEID